MFKLFKSRAAELTTVIAHLGACLSPEDRRRGYEDPLQTLLTSNGLGTVASGCSVMDRDERITCNEIEIALKRCDSTVLDRIVALFDSLGAPKGSWLHDAEENVLRRFGTTEVVVLELDTACLPPGLEASQATAGLVDLITTQISHAGRYQGLRVIGQSTELYFHARGTKSVEAVLAGMLTSQPLCRNARVFRFAAPAPAQAPAQV